MLESPKVRVLGQEAGRDVTRAGSKSSGCGCPCCAHTHSLTHTLHSRTGGGCCLPPHFVPVSLVCSLHFPGSPGAPGTETLNKHSENEVVSRQTLNQRTHVYYSILRTDFFVLVTPDSSLFSLPILDQDLCERGALHASVAVSTGQISLPCVSHSETLTSPKRGGEPLPVHWTWQCLSAAAICSQNKLSCLPRCSGEERSDCSMLRPGLLVCTPQGWGPGLGFCCVR